MAQTNNLVMNESGAVQTYTDLSEETYHYVESGLNHADEAQQDGEANAVSNTEPTSTDINETWSEPWSGDLPTNTTHGDPHRLLYGETYRRDGGVLDEDYIRRVAIATQAQIVVQEMIDDLAEGVESNITLSPITPEEAYGGDKTRQESPQQTIDV